jgi:hypothetical protein
MQERASCPPVADLQRVQPASQAEHRNSSSSWRSCPTQRTGTKYCISAPVPLHPTEGSAQGFCVFTACQADRLSARARACVPPPRTRTFGSTLARQPGSAGGQWGWSWLRGRVGVHDATATVLSSPQHMQRDCGACWGVERSQAPQRTPQYPNVKTRAPRLPDHPKYSQNLHITSSTPSHTYSYIPQRITGHPTHPQPPRSKHPEHPTPSCPP